MNPFPLRAPMYRTLLTLAICLIWASSTGIARAQAPDTSGAMYAGVFAGTAWTDNQIEDVEGFANWGLPGWSLDYHDSGLVAGMLAGRRLELAGIPLRFEVDGMLGDLSARSNRLDPEGLDETVESEIRWLATARVGAEHAIGPVLLFATAGMAVSRIDRSVTDIDSGRDIAPHVDPDDSFSDQTTEVGWVLGAGLETRWMKAWEVRLEGLYMDFGKSTHVVNHSRNNRCGPGGPQRPCPYRIDNALGVVRLGITYRFGS